MSRRITQRTARDRGSSAVEFSLMVAAMAAIAPALDPRALVVSARSPIVLGSRAFGWFHVTFTPAGPVIDAASHATVVLPWAKWACRWRTGRRDRGRRSRTPAGRGQAGCAARSAAP